MGSSRRGDERDFLPFNFTAVMPTDSLAAFLAQIPPLQIAEPQNPAISFTLEEMLSTRPPATVQADMLHLLCDTVRDGDWDNLDSTFRPNPLSSRPSRQNSSPDWIDSFSRQFADKLDHLNKRQNTPPRPKGSHFTPKRPRTTQTIVISSDSEDPDTHAPQNSPPMHRRAALHQDAVEEELSNDSVQEGDSSEVDADHQQELRMQQVSKDIDSDELREFIAFLTKFVAMAQTSGSQARDVEESNLRLSSDLSYLAELRQRVMNAAQEGAIQHVQPKLLSSVISILDIRVSHTLGLFAVSTDGVPNSNCTHADCLLGLNCAQIVLSIITAPNSPRTLLVEEVLDNVISLVRAVCTAFVFPICDPLYSSKSGITQRRRTPRKSRAHFDTGDDHQDPGTPKHSKISKPTLTRKDEVVIDNCCAVFSSLTSLFLKERHLPESTVSQCANFCVHSFSVTGIVRLQLHTMKTVTAVFSAYSAQRISILDNVREKACVVPANRRQLRCFKLGSGRDEIRMTSALIAQLLCHASTDAEEQGAKMSHGRSAEEQSRAWLGLRRKRHDRAAKLAAHLFEPLLSRVFIDREPEYRTAFHTLFEDVLELYGRPEWPSAELILQTISVSIITKLRAQGEKSVYLRSVAVDVLGALAAKMCDLHGNDILKTRRLEVLQKNAEAVEQHREALLLFLNPKGSLQYAAAHSFYEALFVTDDHNLALSLQKRSKDIDLKAKEGADHEEAVDGEDAVISNEDEIYKKVHRKGLGRISRVSKRRSKGDEIDSCQAAEAARAVGMNRSFAGGYLTIIDAILEGMHDVAPTVRAKSIKALSAVDEVSRGILRYIPAILKTIEESCRDVSTLARDAALDLLSRSIVRTTYSNESNCDVEKARDSHPACNREFFAKVFSIVEKRLSDMSTSVRKRAIAIMRAVLSDALERCRSPKMRILSRSPDEEARECEQKIIQICVSLVPRLEDPETSVREASERTLRLGLFGFDVSQQVQTATAQQSESVESLSERLITVFARLPVNIHASFMSRVLHKGLLLKHTALFDAMVSAAVDLLHEYEAKLATITCSQDDVDNVHLQRTISQRRIACASVIAAFAGMNPALVASYCRSLAPSIKGVVHGRVSDGDLICAQRILKVLELGLGHSVEMDSNFLEDILHDIEVIVCQSPVAALEEASIRCLCVIVKRSSTAKAREILIRTAETFMSFLQDQNERIQESCKTNFQSTLPLERNARCALVRLGLLTRFGSFDSEFVLQAFNTLSRSCAAICVPGTNEALARAAVRGLSHLLIRHRPFLTKGTNLLLSSMRSCRQPDGVHNLTCNGNVNEAHQLRKREEFKVGESVHLCVLQGFQELLRDEEDRNSAQNRCAPDPSNPRKGKTSKDMRSPDPAQNGTEKKKESSASGGGSSDLVLAAEEDAEAGFLALSAQAMVLELESSIRSPNALIRRVVGSILGLLVRQGLVLPATIVPSLYCLMLDNDSRCREYSYRVISFLADRHSGMLASASVPAFRTSFETAFFVRYGFNPISASRDNGSAKDLVESQEERCDASPRGVGDVSVEQWLNMTVDRKSGHSLLSPALMALPRDQRRGVLESLLREFDPRVSVRHDPTTDNSTDTNVQEDGMEIVRINGQEGTEDIHDASVKRHRDGDEVDEDVGRVSAAEADISISEKLCPLPSLYFMAITLASIDYTNGAGLGGSLSQGGGTAAADAKLRIAREDVGDLVGIATRIISNSGQVILRVAKPMIKGKTASLAKKRRVALCASRVCLLLALKHHLKVTRWKAASDVGDGNGEDSDITASTVRMPPFTPDRTGLRVYVKSDGAENLESDHDVDSLLELFETLMRSDAIDENDLTTRRSSKGGALRRRSSNRVGGGKRGRATVTNEIIPSSKKERPNRRASVGKAKKVIIDDGSSDGEASEYDPGMN
eukprot:GFKZ01004214.1.p1 GENE.GFKZ01004214.1~~GFKZ01004214.1.p1  ORF type:complete len:1918 (+),score=252.96 GFKZ01004214.1:165-5918(+)